MEQETRFLLALESAASYRISGGTLTLFAADGSIAVTLTRAQ
jgi:heat shock protein HslJ